MDPQVVSLTVDRRPVVAENTPLRELFGLDALPLAEALVRLEVRGVPTAVVNALRRAVSDEMPGRAFQVPAGEGEGFDAGETTDVLMLPQFVNQRITLIPLRPQVPPDVVKRLRLRLDVTNEEAAPRRVFSGDLQIVAGGFDEPFFNPTYCLATVQPGKRLVVDGIHIATGYGRSNAAFCVGRCAAFRHLDLGEHPRQATHLPGGAHVDDSGYKVSCLLADPRHHALTVRFPALGADPAEARATLADACANVLERLRLAAQAIERRGGEHALQGAQFTAITLAADAAGEGLEEGRLVVPGETDTLGALLRRAVYDLEPDISFVGYTAPPHEGFLTVVLRHEGGTAELLLRGARACIAAFEALRRGILSARVEKPKNSP